MEQVQEQTTRATSQASMKRVPELRFPEFNGEWVKYRLGEKCDKVGSGSTPRGGSAVYEPSGVLFIRSQNVNHGRLNLADIACVPYPIHLEMRSSHVAYGDVLLNITGASIGRSCVYRYHQEANVNQHVCIIRSNINSDWLHSWLESIYGQKEVFKGQEGGGREGLNFQSIRKFKLALPRREEQGKIAGFLGVVDARFGLLKRKKELLETYKKGVMQKLFSREIRFKDEEGREYPEWEEKRGNEVFSSISDKNHSSELQILAITQEKGAIPREFIDYDITVTPASISTYKVVREGDFIISLRSFQGGIEYSRYHGICSPAYIILRPHVPICDGFFSAFLKTPAYISQMTSKLEGIRDGKIVSYKYFSETKLPFPSLSEQEAIAGFISLVSVRVDEISLQISESERFKKGLLQKMFV